MSRVVCMGSVDDGGMSNLDDVFSRELAELGRRNLLRAWRVVEGPQESEIESDGRRVVNFASNDYLGLACEGWMRETAREALGKFGWGAGSARLLCGTQRVHVELEEELARWKGTEAALAFSCGFATAVGVIPALVGSEDVVVLDKLCHACLVDGARLSGAVMRVFPHNAVDRLEELLAWARDRAGARRVLVVVESVYSMDGDVAPLEKMVEVAERFDAWVMVDEAHAVGVLGAGGEGLVGAMNLGSRVAVQMGTLGKALGSAGGYVAGSRVVIEWLKNRARSFVFSTAPPAAQAACALAALRWLRTAEGRERMAALGAVRRLWAELHGGGMPVAAIIPVMIGAEERAVDVAGKIWEAGYFAPAVRFPTVPRGKARLRVSLTAKHTPEQLRGLVGVLGAVCPPVQAEGRPSQ